MLRSYLRNLCHPGKMGAIDVGTCLWNLWHFQIVDDWQSALGKLPQEGDDFVGLGLLLRSDSVLCLLSKEQ